MASHLEPHSSASESPAEMALSRLRMLLFVGSVLYPAWWLVQGKLLEQPDHLPSRLVCGAVVLAAALAGLRPGPWITRNYPAVFEAITWGVTAHYFWLMDRSGLHASYVVVAFVLTQAISASLHSRRSWLTYSAFVLVLAAWVARNRWLPLGAVLEGGLFTVLLVGYLSHSNRLYLLSQSEATRQQLESLIKSLKQRREELQTANLRLAETQDQLLQAQKMDAMGKLASGVAHDFNNILGVIMAYASVMKDDAKDDEKLFRRLDIIEKSTERGAELTGKLLSFARRKPKQIERFSLSEVLSEAANMLRPVLAQNIHFTLAVEDGLHEMEGDPSQILQVIMNLAINARDAMTEGGELRVQAFNCPGPSVKLLVSDTGHGIPEEIRGKIFEPFFTTKPAGEGTGLGLSVAYGITQGHRGQIRLLPATSRGTIFELVFPALPAESAKRPKEVKELAVEPQGLNGTRLQGVTILIADDEPWIRQGLSEYLACEGATLVEASDGEEAVARIRSNPQAVGLVILDLGMPRLDGIQALRQIHEIRPDLPAIVASGFPDFRQKHPGLNAQFMQKPFGGSQILELILSLGPKPAKKEASAA